MPARMAQRELPKYMRENVSFSDAESYPRALCSHTIHDSKDEKSRDVATPPSTRPSMRTQ